MKLFFKVSIGQYVFATFEKMTEKFLVNFLKHYFKSKIDLRFVW